MSQALEWAFRELDDAVNDARSAPKGNPSPLIAALVQVLDDEPLRGLIAQIQPERFDIEGWWEACAPGGRGYFGGGNRLEWPRSLEDRIACRLGIAREAAKSDHGFTRYVIRFMDQREGIAANQRQFIDQVLAPLARDLRYLAERRQLPAVLGESLSSGFPETGDQQLDELLETARLKFADRSPAARKEGLERLWDAFERLKTMAEGDKKQSVTQLLDRAAPEAAVRELLEMEAKRLTEIGNVFDLRHFERGKATINDSRHVDYLFHRMCAMIWVLVSAIENPSPSKDE